MVILEDEPDPAVAERGEFALGKRERVGPFERDVARAGPVERAEHVQQRALSGTGRPHDRERVAAIENEIHVVQHPTAARSASGIPSRRSSKRVTSRCHSSIRAASASVPRP